MEHTELDAAGFEAALAAAFDGVLPCPPDVVPRLFAHFDLLRRWNRRLNLTSIRNDADMVLRHYCESLFLGRHLPAGALSVVDIGSGGGFPGIPVALLRPDIRMCLVESHQRKAVFLREATREAANIRVFSGRAGQLGESFDWLVSRGVSASDLDRIVPALAPQYAVLAGETFFTATTGRQIPLPWGERRYLHLGSIVPRGT